MNVVLATSIIAVLALVKNGKALECWECTSDEYGTCKDYFNTAQYPRGSSAYSTIPEIPRIKDCYSGAPQLGQTPYDSRQYPYNNQQFQYGNQFGNQGRPVCMKMVEKNRRSGVTRYIRSCHYLTPNEYIGSCLPRSSGGDISVEFCEYCDTYGCNGAQGLQKSTFLMGLIPIIVALALRK